MIVKKSKLFHRVQKSNKMCSEIFSKIFWIGSKILIVFGALSYLFDIGSDVLFSIQLYISCHVSTGTASICIFLASISFSIFFASNSAWYDFWYLPKFLKLFFKELTGAKLNDEEKKFIHSVKFIECLIESVPQIGISFYMIHHYELDDAVLLFDGDLQMLTLTASILSINLSLATRRAWWRTEGKAPSRMDIFKGFLWNVLPVSCFLIAYFIIMADSSLILIVYSCVSPIPYVIFLIIWMGLFHVNNNLFFKLTDWTKITTMMSMNLFLLLTTFIMACLHTVQIYAIGSEGQESLLVKPFNTCLTANDTTLDQTLKDQEEKLNMVHSNQALYIIIIWSAVIMSLIHSVIEAFYTTKRERAFFFEFVLFSYNMLWDPDWYIKNDLPHNMFQLMDLMYAGDEERIDDEERNEEVNHNVINNEDNEQNES